MRYQTWLVRGTAALGWLAAATAAEVQVQSLVDIERQAETFLADRFVRGKCPACEGDIAG